MSFEVEQKVKFTTDWGSVHPAEIVAVLPDGSKYEYVVEYTDEDDGETLADFADSDSLEALEPELTLNEEQLQELRNVLRVAKADHRDKFGQDCNCQRIIDRYLELVETALRGEA